MNLKMRETLLLEGNRPRETKDSGYTSFMLKMTGTLRSRAIRVMMLEAKIGHAFT
jgi:hypothetical protein